MFITVSGNVTRTVFIIIVFFLFFFKDGTAQPLKDYNQEKRTKNKQGKLQKAVVIIKSQVMHSCHLRIVNKKFTGTALGEKKTTVF